LEFETIFPLPRENEDEPQWFLSRLGKSRPSSAALKALAQLDEHWDLIANIIREGKVHTQPMLGRFLQDLPNLLEAGTVQPVASVPDQRQVDQLKRDLFLAHSQITALYSSRSFRITAPLRHIVRRLSTYKTRELDD
jgi:lipopolysaccharide transport system ATP-binding protein